MIDKYYNAVHLFMRTGEQFIGDVHAPMIPSTKICLQRYKFGLSEQMEFGDALDKGDFPEAVDAIIDKFYILLGDAIALGLTAYDLDVVFDMVHERNMAKFPDGKCVKIEGKVQKPEGWYGPEKAINEYFLRAR